MQMKFVRSRGSSAYLASVLEAIYCIFITIEAFNNQWFYILSVIKYTACSTELCKSHRLLKGNYAEFV